MKPNRAVRLAALVAGAAFATGAAFAQNSPSGSAAGQAGKGKAEASKPVPVPMVPMKVVSFSPGPLPETRIVKLEDTQNGALCYLYVPFNLSTAQNCVGNQCVPVVASALGSISCVEAPAKK